MSTLDPLAPTVTVHPDHTSPDTQNPLLWPRCTECTPCPLPAHDAPAWPTPIPRALNAEFPATSKALLLLPVPLRSQSQKGHMGRYINLYFILHVFSQPWTF